MILACDNSPEHINNKHANNKRNQQFGYNALPPKKIQGRKHPSNNQCHKHGPHKPFHIIIVSNKGLCLSCFFGAAKKTVKCPKNGAKKKIDLRVGVNKGFHPVKTLTYNWLYWLDQFFHGYFLNLESPLLGGDLGVGKAVIREIFTEISRPRDPPLTPPKRGIIRTIIEYVDLVKHGQTSFVPATQETRLNKMKIPIQSSPALFC